MANSRIYLSPPDIGAKEIEYVIASMKSGWVAPAGPDLISLENSMAALTDRNFAVATSSGTSALHLALLAVGVQPGDHVLCPTLTFVATANAISYIGATPILIDAEMDDGNVSVTKILEALESLALQKRRVGAVIGVDLLGKVANYAGITELCDSKGIPVVSDAAESLGSRRMGKPAGSFGDVAIFSFNGNKIVTTSAGGMLVTDDEAIAKRVRNLSTQAREPLPYYEHREIGFNYRMSNVLAAIGRAQLERLDSIIEKRRYVRSFYRDIFSGHDGLSILGDNDSEDNCWLTAVVADSRAGWKIEDLRLHLEAADIESRYLWKPMHLQPIYAGAPAYLSGNSEMLFERSLVLPSGTALLRADLARIEEAIVGFLGKFY